MRQQEQKRLYVYKLFNCSNIFLEGKKTLCLVILSSYQLASVTEAFFCDRNFCLWQNCFSVIIVFFCDRTFFSVIEMCFSGKNFDRKLFLWWKFVLWRTFFLWQKSLSDRNLYLWHKKISLTQVCSHGKKLCCINLFLWQKLVLSKKTVWVFYRLFMCKV